MTSQHIIHLTDTYIMNTYGRFPVALARGEGSTLYDFEGRSYLDFTSGVGVSSVGYAHPKWVKAVADQAATLAHTSNLFHTRPAGELAKRLCELSGLSKVFFANGGAEANEGVLKTARKYSSDKYGEGRSTILTLANSFHGRTITTLSATGQEKYHKHFGPFTPGFQFVPANDTEALQNAPDGVCALLLETVQGEGGVLPLDADYIRAAEKICRERDWLLMFDEVQTGIYRTGKPFAYQHSGVVPDVVSFAKGIAGGLPLGGFLAGPRCCDVFGPGEHGTTFGGNAVSCADALAVLDILAGEDIEAKAKHLRGGLETSGIPVRGMGLMLAIPREDPRGDVLKLIDNGLLALTAGDGAVRLLPPLTISLEDIDKGLAILREVLT
jgi:acetylornithine/N-succinyldiaminopimelate aminotransferase